MTRDVAAEWLGTTLLLFVIVGSGIAARELGSDGAGQLFAHAVAVGLALSVLILMFQTVSGSHFNPAVTIGFWRQGSMNGPTALRYVAAQLVGAVSGVVLANLSFGVPAVSIATTERTGFGSALSEGVGTFVLVLLILALVQSGRATAIPAAVGAWIAAIVFATSSTGFANPAVTIARMFSDTYTGIAPSSVPTFLVAQLVAALLAVPVAKALYPSHVKQTANA